MPPTRRWTRRLAWFHDDVSVGGGWWRQHGRSAGGWATACRLGCGRHRMVGTTGTVAELQQMFPGAVTVTRPRASQRSSPSSPTTWQPRSTAAEAVATGCSHRRRHWHRSPAGAAGRGRSGDAQYASARRPGAPRSWGTTADETDLDGRIDSRPVGIVVRPNRSSTRSPGLPAAARSPFLVAGRSSKPVSRPYQPGQQ